MPQKEGRMHEPGLEAPGLDREPGYWTPFSFSVSVGEEGRCYTWQDHGISMP